MLVVQLIVLKEPKKYWNTSPIINPPTANCHFNWIIHLRQGFNFVQTERKESRAKLFVAETDSRNRHHLPQRSKVPLHRGGASTTHLFLFSSMYRI